MNTSFDPQLKSKFFALPTELRLAIYAYFIPDQIHVLLHESQSFGFSKCIQYGGDEDPDCISQRSNDMELGQTSALDPIFGRRLRSSWGPHWRCEELAMHMRESYELNYNITTIELLGVCKRMFSEVIEMMADTTAVHVNDLDTLRNLFPLPGEIESGQASTSVLLSSILPNLKELNITLRLHWVTYKALESNSDSGGSESSLSSVWTGLLLAVKHLSKLRRLQIWLDHTGPCSWSMVNERAVLSPLASLTNIPNLEVYINLPKLHPKWESPHRHFTENSSPLPLAIHRRYRQRYHGIENSDGSIRLEHKADFPEMYQLTYWPEDPMTIEEVEEMERRSWSEGEELTQVFRDGPLTSSTLSI